jgi:1-deoxy-D-xylulose-5-phosphate reductoisomerase
VNLALDPSNVIVAHLPKRIAILGSTGSIGTNALEVIAHLGREYQAVALSTHRQTTKMFEQARTCGTKAVCICDDGLTALAVRSPENPDLEIYHGKDGLLKIVERDDVDIVLSAIVGAAGLPAALATVRAGKILALANKESLVVAGSLLIPEAKKHNAKILPVDSEHSAIFQAMLAGRLPEVRRVILTASGGPFRRATVEQINNATLADAMNHPTWKMGNKITIDSATMFNKALELIEACWLFDLPPEKIEIVVHPESVVHSMVEFVDGSVIAQLSPPDMRTPIQYALTYPERSPGISRKLDLTKAFELRFEPPDFQRFPALGIAYEVARMRGTAGAVMNAANEVAVASFMAGNIAFGEISTIVRLTIDGHTLQPRATLDDLLKADQWARSAAEDIVGSKTACR